MRGYTAQPRVQPRVCCRLGLSQALLIGLLFAGCLLQMFPASTPA